VKQIAQYQDGRLELQEVPLPALPPGGVLVRTTHSVISIGTEKMKVEQARMNLLQKARARPDQVRKVLDTARNLGWKNALEKVRNRLETPTPLGYSAAGIIEAVDPLNTRFRVGDRVACAGAECAFHAEWIALPDLLVAKIPDRVEGWQASYTTLAAIAMQAVRQAEPSLGDRFLVMGQGLIGLLITNLLQLAGARVLAVDLQAAREKYARLAGAERFVIPGAQNLPDCVRDWTEGMGVDAAIVCTATQSNAPIEQSAEALRDRGRLVDVGITKIELPWKIFYEKELEVRFSRSYGPGRYDPSYEWGGHDYPVGYVRWTEQRNFDACLHLMATGGLKLAELTTKRAPFENALEIYAALGNPGTEDIGVVLEYRPGKASLSEAKPGAPARNLETRKESKLDSACSVVDVIGAGNFARTMLLPHLKGRVELGWVVNQTSLSANHVRTKFGFASAGTDPAQALSAAGRRAVLIATRHHLHEQHVVAALTAGRPVFVEKPLCLTLAELRSIDRTVQDRQGHVQVGFNRRFAPASLELQRALARCPGPKSATFLVNAGRLDPQHWYAHPAESGGRVLGEACHFFDYLCFLLGSPVRRVTAQPIGPVGGRLPFPDSIAAQIEFADGSSGQLIYSGDGDSSFPKESLTVFASGLVGRIENFQELTLHSGRKERRFRYTSKGHAEQMASWLAFLSGHAEPPLPYAVARESMRLTFAALESIRSSAPVEMDRFEA